MLLVKLVYNSNIMKTLIKLKAIDYEGGLDTLFGSQLKTKVKQIKGRRPVRLGGCDTTDTQ